MRKSIRFDNGNEFAEHHSLHKSLGLQTFFCDPHSPWQKGGVENSIGRLRRFLPRKADLNLLTAADLRRHIHRLNNTPRKCLDFKTPAEAFSKLKSTVALQTGIHPCRQGDMTELEEAELIDGQGRAQLPWATP
jgi:IS30 family transposase